MGFDPSVELVRDDVQGNFYNIAVGDTHYKTVKVLHDLGADYLLSRAARVFKVKRVGDPEDNFYVLKDLWLEQDRKPEHEIYNEIIRDVENLYGDQVDIVRRHLFTPIDHAFVEVNGVRVSRCPAHSAYLRLTHKPWASYGHALGLSDWRLVSGFCYALTGRSSRREVSLSGVGSGLSALATCDADTW